jgi:hypothetical protein
MTLYLCEHKTPLDSKIPPLILVLRTKPNNLEPHAFLV